MICKLCDKVVFCKQLCRSCYEKKRYWEGKQYPKTRATYYQKNKNKILLKGQEWRKNNPDKVKVIAMLDRDRPRQGKNKEEHRKLINEWKRKQRRLNTVYAQKEKLRNKINWERIKKNPSPSKIKSLYKELEALHNTAKYCKKK